MISTRGDTLHCGPAAAGVTELFEALAARRPDSIAVVHKGESLCFADVNARANQLARELLAAGAGTAGAGTAGAGTAGAGTAGAGPERIVAVALPRSAWSVVAVLAIWKAGAAYLPLDPAYPPRRIEEMLRDAAPAVLVTERGLVDRARGAGGRPVLLDDPGTLARLARYPGGDLDSTERPGPQQDRHAAYVIYTSGSTGRPKGVVVERGALANLVRHFNPQAPTFGAALRSFGSRPLRLSHTTSWSFDASLAPLLWMCHGNELHVVEEAVRLDPDALLAYVRRHGIDHLDLTPTQLRWLLRRGLLETGRPLFLVAGGEPMPQDLWDEVAAATAVSGYNAYGPTECAVEATCAAIGQARVSIGRPIANTDAYLLDERLRPVPPGEPGELYLGGAGLARGYLNRPAVTASRFVANPFGRPGARMYRTGDLARWQDSGALEFVGRGDGQLKVRGFRVEPGEIEAALRELPGVVDAAVIAAGAQAQDDQRLVAFVVPPPTGAPDPVSLRAQLAGLLPRYLVPAQVVVVDELPQTHNGKLDRAALCRAAPVSRPEPEPLQPLSGPDPAGREELIRALFVEVLGGAQVTPGDGFFALGGDSIIAMRLVSQARRAGLAFSVQDVFRLQTPRALAPAATVLAGPATGCGVDDESGDFPLTPIMRWLGEVGGPTGGYRQSMVFRTPAALRRAQLMSVVDSLLARHGALRMSLRPVGAQAARVAPTAAPAVELVEVVPAAGLCPAELGARIAEAERDAGAWLDPHAGRVLRAVWFDARPGPGHLLLVIHHLAIDGVSWRILHEDLVDAWAAIRGGAPAAVPPARTTSLRRWAHLLRADAERRFRKGELELWTQTLAGTHAPWGGRALEPATDTVATARTLTVSLPPEPTGRLLTVAPERLRARISELLLAAMAAAVVHWRGGDPGVNEDAVLLDVEGHGRGPLATELDLSRTVGWFTNVYPVRLPVGWLDWADLWAGGAAWRELVQRCKERLREIPDHGLGYGLLRYLHPAAGSRLATRPQPQICVNYLGRLATDPAADWSPVPVTGMLLDGADGRMPLSHPVTVDALTHDEPTGPRLVATFTWAGGLLAEEDVGELARTWMRALSALARHANESGAGDLAPSDVPLVSLSQTELSRLTAAWETQHARSAR